MLPWLTQFASKLSKWPHVGKSSLQKGCKSSSKSFLPYILSFRIFLIRSRIFLQQYICIIVVNLSS